jgi:hypothetical protein
MNAKKCCCRLSLAVLAFVAFSIGNATTSFYGVINPNGHAVWVDTAIVTAPPRPDTFVTTGWGSASVAIDTFHFPDIAAWPVLVVLQGTVDGIRLPYNFPSPASGVWFDFMPVPPPPPNPQAMFYGVTGVEESRSATQPRPCLDVSPSVVTAQMTVRLACPGPARPVVEVFDAAGNLIRSLNCTPGANGFATATWHCEDGLGRLVPGGIYFCRSAAPGAVAVRKVLVAR